MVSRSDIQNGCGCGGNCGGTCQNGSCPPKATPPNTGIVPPHLEPSTAVYKAMAEQAETSRAFMQFPYLGCSADAAEGTQGAEPFVCPPCPIKFALPTVLLCSADGRPLGYQPAYDKDGNIVNWSVSKPSSFCPEDIDISIASSMNIFLAANNILVTGADSSPQKSAKITLAAQGDHVHNILTSLPFGAIWLRTDIDHEKRRALSLKIELRNFFSWIIQSYEVNRDFTVEVPKALSEDARILILLPYLSKQSQPAATFWCVSNQEEDQPTATRLTVKDVPAEVGTRLEYCNAGSPSFQLAVFALMHFLPMAFRNVVTGNLIK